jgi:asparagine synthase (glutamine-hydrolysing)
MIWGCSDAHDRLAGHTLCDGRLFGVTARPARTYAEVAATWGAFLSVRAEPGTGSVSVLRDCSGRIPAYWARAEALDIVCSHIEDLAAYRNGGWDIDWAYLTHMLLDETMPAERTGFAGVQEILPGQEITFSRGEASSRMAWRPIDHLSSRSPSYLKAAHALRRAAEMSVELWTSRYSSLTLDLSGGLDSSAIAGLLSQARRPPDLLCLNAVVGHPESDEREFARASAQLHGAPLVEISLEHEIADYEHTRSEHLLPRPSTRLLRIGLGRSALNLARAADAQGYVTGRGGDHLFFDQVPAASATDYIRETGNLLGWLRCAYFASRLTGEPVAKVLGRAFDRPSAPEKLARQMAGSNSLVTDEASETSDAMAFAHPWLVQAVERAHPAKFLQISQIIELQRHYDRIGRAAEIDEIHPFISQPMFEAALRTPAFLFAPSTVRRQLQRDVFADLLPATVLARQTKSGTTSHFVRTMEANLSYLRGVLLDGEMSRRGIVDRAKLEARLTMPALRTSTSLMELVRCVIVELWLIEAQAFVARVTEPASPALPPSRAIPPQGLR